MTDQTETFQQDIEQGAEITRDFTAVGGVALLGLSTESSYPNIGVKIAAVGFALLAISAGAEYIRRVYHAANQHTEAGPIQSS
ncbi:MAG: hypothetical protein ACXWLH_03870 [Candidatus Saccharimonadales bacterium]